MAVFLFIIVYFLWSVFQGMSGEKGRAERVRDILEDKDTVTAGISYLLLFLSIFGMIVDIILYYESKNRYAKFHAGQACFTALVMYLAGLVIIAPLSIAGTYLAVVINPALAGSPWEYFGISMAFIYGYLAINLLIYVYLAILAFRGRDFRVPIAARLLEW